MSKERVFSGIQPTGQLHIGNYLGAVKNWLSLLDKYECIFCIVDYHAATIEYDIEEMQNKIFQAACEYLAAGLLPERCTVFVQSYVPEHTELAWLFNTVTPMGELSRMTQFKEKSRQHEENINAGLFTYPILQAADILLYKAVAVPVGEDQIQHIELAREVARKFNARFGEIFPEPKPLVSQTPKVLGMDGNAKMSKSLGNHIPMSSTDAEIWEKLRPAKTDEARQRRQDPGNPDVCNIFTIHKGFSPAETIAAANRECRNAGIGCIDCKKMLFESMKTELGPIRQATQDWSARPNDVHDILAEGARRCKAIAGQTMDEVRVKMGMR